MREHDHPNLGRLVTPRHYCSLHEHRGWPWAADNDCFQGLDPAAYIRMLDALVGAPGECLFVTVPDVVADAMATAKLFEVWWRALARRGLPAALVAQDSLEHLDRWLSTAWPRIDALFLGGSTDWKLGPTAEALVAAARNRGKWVHMGRVTPPAVSATRPRSDATRWMERSGCAGAIPTSTRAWRRSAHRFSFASTQKPGHPQMSVESASVRATRPFQFRTLRVRWGGERSRRWRRRSSNAAYRDQPEVDRKGGVEMVMSRVKVSSPTASRPAGRHGGAQRLSVVSD